MTVKSDIPSEIIQKRDDILEIAKRFGASNIRIFGSVAKGESGPESDIDFLVDFEKGRSLLDHASLKLALEDLLGISVDVATEKGLKDRIRDRVLKEAVPI